jgi:hypothetical protein
MTEEALTIPDVGTKVSDGTVFAGISPTNHQPMYLLPAVKHPFLDFNEAAIAAQNVEFSGKKDFRVPTSDELGIIYKHKWVGSMLPSFNSAAPIGAWKAAFWSSTPYVGKEAMSIRIGDGQARGNNKTQKLSVCFVRG